MRDLGIEEFRDSGIEEMILQISQRCGEFENFAIFKR
jgi:hypothetical protein